MKSIGLVSCTSRKKSTSCKASEMYSASQLFRKAYRYCRKNYSQVAILSAKYGFLFPDDEIEPYNLTLNNMNAEEVKNWSERVIKQMRKRLDLNNIDTVFFHAGNNYRKYLIPRLEALGVECEVPLANMRIGEQLKWYKTHDC